MMSLIFSYLTLFRIGDIRFTDIEERVEVLLGKIFFSQKDIEEKFNADFEFIRLLDVNDINYVWR